MPAESEPAVGHVDPFASVLLDERVDVGDGGILVVLGVVEVHRGHWCGVTQRTLLEGGSHPWYVEHARDREVVAPADEGKARDELLHGHLGRRRHHRLTLRCEYGVQIDVREAAADADDGAERDAAQEVAVLEHLRRRRDVDAGAAGGGADDVQLRRVGGLPFDCEERCEGSARVSPEADRRGGVEAGGLEADGGSDAVEHEAGSQRVARRRRAVVR